MKNILVTAIILMSSPMFMGTSCKKVTQTNDNGNPCAGVMCTMMFAMISVEVVDDNGRPVKLDNVFTIRKSNGENITLEQNMAEGRYNVLDDSYQKKLVNTMEEYRFIGYRNGVKLVDEPYTLGADCCHVKKERGRDLVKVQ